MDNHRAAMWCWLQHVDPGQPHSLFDMDRHYDCLQPPEWLENCPEDIQKLSIDEYLNFDYALNDFNHGERASVSHGITNYRFTSRDTEIR